MGHALTTVQDIAVDATMVRDHVNPQIASADNFTREMLKKAQDNGIPRDQVTVTGHSLGGTLAEAEASKFQLGGTTYNAFGAVGIVPGVPEGGSKVTNYVMAGDVVSAGHHHYGHVVPLASKQDIDSLKAGRYLDAPAGSPPPNSLIAMRLGDHGIVGNFNGANSLLIPDNLHKAEQRYADNKGAVDAYRGDVYRERGELAATLRQMEHGTPSVHLPPDVQRQVNEYLALNADPAIQQAIEQNAKVRGAEHGLQQGSDALRAGGQYVQSQDERLAAGARTVGDFMAPVNPVAPLAGAVLGEAAHLQGQAAHAVGDFAASELQSAEHVVERGAHHVSQTAQAAIHNPEVQAAAVSVVNRIVDTYGRVEAAGHTIEQSYDSARQTVSHGIDAIERAPGQAYDATKQAVSHSIDTAERNIGQAYDTLAHPVQSFERAVSSEMSPAIDSARHQQRALHGEGSQVDRAHEAQRQQETQGHTAARAAPLSPAAAIQPGTHAPQREAQAPRHDPHPTARSMEAPPSPPTRPEAATTGAEPNHVAMAAQQAHQQAMMHAQRQAQHERQQHEGRSASPARAAPSLEPGRVAEAAALAPAAIPTLGAAATAAPRVSDAWRDDRAPAQAPSRADPQTPAPIHPDAQRPDPAHAAASSVPAAGHASPAAPRTVADPASTSRQAAEPLATGQHGTSQTNAAPALSPPLDPPSMRDFRHAEHPLNPRYQMFRDALGEQGFHAVGRPTLNAVPEVRGFNAEQKDRLAAGFTAQLGADTRYHTEIQHFDKNGEALLAVEHPQRLGNTPLVLAIDKTQTLARTPEAHAAAWRARELPEPQAVNTARPDPRTLSPDHPGHLDHPRHAMFENARAALSGEYARWGMQKGAEPLDRETMQVMTAARERHMDDVGAVRLWKGSPDGRIGEYPQLTVYETPKGPQQRMSEVGFVPSQTLQQAPPVHQAAQQFQAVDQQATQQVQQAQQLQAQVSAQGQQRPMPGGPGMGR